MKQKLLLTTSILIMLMLFSSSLFAETTAAAAYAGGDGTSTDPYQIATLAQLRRLSETTADWSKHFIQTADIDAKETNTWNVGDADKNETTPDVFMGFYPIGDSNFNSPCREAIPFTGNYQGNGYTIDNLYIYRPKENFVGLFGSVNRYSNKIQHLAVTNANITGNHKVGIIAGESRFTKISNCYTTGEVAGNNNTGGLVGWCGYAENCYSTASVNSDSYKKGSLGTAYAGTNLDYHTHCYYQSTTGEKDSYDKSYGFPRTAMQMGVISQYTNWDIEIDNTLTKGAPPILKKGTTKWVMNPSETINLTLNIMCEGVAVPNAAIEYFGTYTSDETGQVTIEVLPNSSVSYKIMASGYQLSEGNIELLNEDITKTIILTKSFDGGEGTLEDPFQIHTLDQLRNLSENYLDWDKCFIQTANIDATETNKWNEGDADKNETTPDVFMGFYPIGDSNINSPCREAIPFTGNYQGNGYTIDNLYIYRPKENFVGLFGSVNNRSNKIQHLAVTNANITGNDNVGIIAGESIETEISNCYTTGEVAGNNNTGGLVGWCGYAENCYSTASVNSDSYKKGSLGVAYWKTNLDNHTNCYYQSTTGEKDPYKESYGFPRTAMQMGVISQYTNWDIEIDNTLTKGAPPILKKGTTKWVMNPSETINLTLNIMCEGVAVSNAIIECLGTHSSDETGQVIVPVLTNSSVSYKIMTSGYQLSEGNIELLNDEVTKTITLTKSFDGGEGTLEDPFQIHTLDQLRNLSENYWDWDKCFIQTADIDASATNTWNMGDADKNETTPDVAMGFYPIGDSDSNFPCREAIPFTGNYQGNGYTIDNLYIYRPQENFVGLFGSVNNRSNKIQHLAVTNANITGNRRVGIIAGESISTRISDCYTTGTVVGNYNTGGLVGKCGYAENCYSTATVNSSSNQKGSLGVAVWEANLDNHTNCYYQSTTGEKDPSSQSYGEPLTELQMRTESSFINWDFVEETTNGEESIWAISPAENSGYPYLARGRSVVNLALKRVKTTFKVGQQFPLTSISGVSNETTPILAYRLHNGETPNSWSSDAPTQTGVYDVKVDVVATEHFLADEVILEEAWTITKGNPTISFNNIKEKTFGDSDFDLTATTNGDGTIKYVSSNNEVATINGNTVTIVGAGTVNITASCDATKNCYAATDVVQELVVNKAVSTITFNDIDEKTFGDADFDLTATINGDGTIKYVSSNSEVATIIGNTVTIVGAGTANITASCDATTNYLAATTTQALVVNKAVSTITFNDIDEKTFGDANFDLTATTNGDGIIKHVSSNNEVATINGNTVTIVGAGTANITASCDATTNYLAATTTQALVVNSAVSTITFNEIDEKTFGDADFDLTATTNGDGTIKYVSSNSKVATVIGNTVTIVGAGTANITASSDATTNYLAATNVVQELVVNKAASTITFNEIDEKTFGDPDFDLTATTNGDGTIKYVSSNSKVATVIGNTVTIVGAGTANITASSDATTNYLAATNVVQELVVNKAASTITFNEIDEKTFGDPDFDLTATTNGDATIKYVSSNSEVATINGNTVTIVGAGAAKISACCDATTNYLAATDVVQELVVNKAVSTITFNDIDEKTFGDANFDLTATTNGDGIIKHVSSNNEVATINGNTVTIVGAGTANITASCDATTNYLAATTTQALVVNKAVSTITFNDIDEKTFGDANFDLTATTNGDGIIKHVSSNNEVATINGNTVTIVGAGTANITASCDATTNYLAATTTQALVVNSAVSTITFNEIDEKTFGDADFDLTATTNGDGTIKYVSSNSEVATVIGNTVTIVGAGTANITASCDATTNYLAATNVVQELVVNKAASTITFNEIDEKTFGDPDFDLTATTNGDGTVTFASSNSEVATINGNTVTIVGAGTANITASCDATTNYLAATTTQALVVNSAVSTITFNEIDEKTFGDPDFDLTATTNGDATIKYVSSNSEVATINGNTVTIVGAGTANITASCDATTNYLAATTTQALVVNKAVSTINFNEIDEKTFGDADFDLTATTNGDGTIKYVSSNSEVATINGNTVTIVGAGTANITASCDATTNYLAATTTQALVVNKAVSTINFNEIDEKTFGDANFDLTATTDGDGIIKYVSSNNEVATINDNTVTIVGAGTANITASCDATTNYLAATDVVQELVVNKAVSTITFNEIDEKTFNDADFDLTATTNGDGTVTFASSNSEVATIIGKTLTIVGAGTANISASCDATSNYLAATTTQALVVNKASSTITFNDIDVKTFGDANFDLTATTNGDATIKYVSSNSEVATINGNTVTIVGAGTANISACCDATKNCCAAKSVVRKLVVRKGKGDITWDIANSSIQKNIEDKPFDLSKAWSNIEEAIIVYTSSNEEVVSVIDNTVTIVGLGTATITAKATAKNYNDATATLQVVVTKATSTPKTEKSNFILYPNPATDFITIEGDAKDDITIFSITGVKMKIVYNKGRIDVRDLPRGIYLVKYHNEIYKMVLK
ncbi:T9SS type A sorting domain-containing protein [Halosquirtibacter laminarini]|uniref:T9SS type A sorting domain-containing protein n=1 Tax=Halosquirtibacter laminarini TaxID=3374600 RepID=A0AC61NB07_9BACT|nr:T9SS type A sorting domain-containing protein [Prolixibacteraceae bacterium]